jgi:hypothetical protein
VVALTSVHKKPAIISLAFHTLYRRLVLLAAVAWILNRENSSSQRLKPSERVLVLEHKTACEVLGHHLE